MSGSVHAADALDRSLLECAALIHARRLSPVALAEASLERIQRVGSRLACFVTVTPDVALREAQAAEDDLRRGHYRGPLHGIPFGLKDNIDTKGIGTTWGSRLYANRVPNDDAVVVQRLRRAGAVLVGKLALTELAMGVSDAHSSISGACRNPWDTSRWAGGSSSGPAAAVAARLVGFAVGSATNGSIVGPAILCGVPAFRPTYGAVPRTGVLPFAFSLDKIGPFARTAQDCAAVLASVAGRDPRDPSSVRPPPGLHDVHASSVGQLRAAVLEPPPDASLDVQVLYQGALRVLGDAGVRLEQGSLPDLPWQSVASVITEAEADVAFDDLVRSGHAPELADPFHRGKGWYSLPGRPSDYVRAQVIRAEMQRAMRDFFARYDLVVSVPSAIPPLVDEPIPATGGEPMTTVGNLLGLPAAAVPMGFTPPGKLPAGFIMTGPAMADARVLATAALYQSRTTWHLERPPILGQRPN
jgi:aspartyl-tRNA(Asn)/glutamyl-tRNA(Gln) amidotransferase subunit A